MCLVLLSLSYSLPSFVLTDEDMRLWHPSLQEVMEAFHSLGAHNPALYPLGPFQHGSRWVPPLPPFLSAAIPLLFTSYWT